MGFDVEFDDTTNTYSAVFDEQPFMHCHVCGAKLGFEPGLKTPYLCMTTGKLYCKEHAGGEKAIFEALKIQPDLKEFLFVPLASLKVRKSFKDRLLGFAGLVLSFLKI